MKIDAEAVRWSAPPEERADRPVLIMLHGHGLDESVGFELISQLPDELVIASLRGPLRARGGYGWFPLDQSLRVEQVDQSATAVLDWLGTQDLSGPIGLLGFSQGTATAFQVLRSRPDVFSFGVNLSGAVVPLPSPTDQLLRTRQIPVFYGRGDRDPVIPALLVQATRHWLQGNTRLTEKVYRGLGHTVNDAEIADLSAFIEQQIAQQTSDGAAPAAT